MTAKANAAGIAGISAADVSITGGSVNVYEGRYFGLYSGGTVTLGADAPDTGIMIRMPDPDTTFVIKEGRTLTDGENDYAGTLTAEQIREMDGKTLTCRHSYSDQGWTFAEGSVHTRVCETCGGAPEFEEHDVIVKGAGEATCGYEGYTGDEFCSVCGQKLSEGAVIPPTGDHVTAIVGEKEATATEDGYTGDEVCTVCGLTVRQGEVIPATDGEEPEKPASGRVCPVCNAPHDKNLLDGLIGLIHSLLFLLMTLDRTF